MTGLVQAIARSPDRRVPEAALIWLVPLFVGLGVCVVYPVALQSLSKGWWPVVGEGVTSCPRAGCGKSAWHYVARLPMLFRSRFRSRLSGPIKNS
jgi:hypothetical protein